MAHPEPSSRLLIQRKRAREGAPLLDWCAIGGVGGCVKGVKECNGLITQVAQSL
jgi:hypothetical protein